jgi:hypothetical protein
METLGDKIQLKISQKSVSKYHCILCDYNTSKKCNYDTHILSAKHLKVTHDYQMGQNSANIQPTFCHPTKEKFICSCGKDYQHRQGLWRHKKKCKIEVNHSINDETEDYKTSEIHELKEFMKYLMKENSDMKNMMMEVIKSGTNNQTIHTNSHNKTFNLNMFLNETCKDAMNINDFVDSLQLQLSDLEKVGEVGYIEGISNIIIKNLNALDVTLRPVHCTDKKRETMYIKDEDKWEKEDTNKAKLHKMVRKVANKNIHLIQDFREKYPDCIKSSSRHSDKYNKIIVESMGGTGDNEHEKEEKIIKRVAKEVLIDKSL